jgi:hypothetical protein
MSLSVDVLAQLAITQVGDNDFGGPRFDPRVEKRIALTNGTGANQADICWLDDRTLASGASDDLDLAGALSDALADTVNMAELVGVVVIAAASNTTSLTIGGGSNPFLGFLGGTSPTVGPLPGGTVFLLVSPGAAGIGTVTADTGDILRITNGSGANASYKIGLIGRSA